MRIVALIHTDKEGMLPLVADLPEPMRTWLIVNAPLSLNGQREAFELIDRVRPLGPFARGYCSRLGRTAQAMSFLALAFDIDFTSLWDLGQCASMERDGQVYCLPGYEEYTYVAWQQQGLDAVRIIAESNPADSTILVVSSGPIVAGIAEHCLGIHSEENLKEAVPAWRKRGVVIFDVSADGMSITLTTDQIYERA